MMFACRTTVQAMRIIRWLASLAAPQVAVLTALCVSTVPGARAAESNQAPAAAPAASRQPSLLLVTVDTTRWDHLQPYGDANIETPTLAKLAADGVLFEQAYSVAPITLPAHTAI